MHPLLAIGSGALDIKARLARAPLPTTDVPGRITLKPGGVARNIAENLARLGMPIVCDGIMGDDPAARLLIDLSRAVAIVEAQAAGCPVIAFGKSGALETVTAQTGIFFEEQTAECLMDAVEKFDHSSESFDTGDLVSNASRFSKERFKIEFASFIQGI